MKLTNPNQLRSEGMREKQIDMNALARLGAQLRLAALARERAALEHAFPSVRLTSPTVRGRQAVVRTPAKHWTQRPENRTRMLRIIRKANRARRK